MYPYCLRHFCKVSPVGKLGIPSIWPVTVKLRCPYQRWETNPADGLTKSPEHASMFNNMVNACGLERIPHIDLLIAPEDLYSEALFLAETAEKANALASHLAVFESVARNLARVKLLVVELYYKEGSALESACQKEEVPYFGSSRIDL